MITRSVVALALTGVTVALASPRGTAGQDAQAPGVAPRAPLRQTLSLNPLAAVLGFYTAEYERAVSPSATLGLAGSYWETEIGEVGDLAGVDYFSTEAKARYYPSGRALSGFALGVSAGYSRLTGHVRDDGDERRGTANAASAGFELGYNWLLGKRRNVAFGLGAGAKRLFVLGDGTENVTLAYPTVRLSVGFAF